MNQQHNTKTKDLNLDRKMQNPAEQLLHHEPEMPLFLRDTSEGKKSDAQDEKDETEE